VDEFSGDVNRFKLVEQEYAYKPVGGVKKSKSGGVHDLNNTRRAEQSQQRAGQAAGRGHGTSQPEPARGSLPATHCQV
jgi:hypothetical protein